MRLFLLGYLCLFYSFCIGQTSSQVLDLPLVTPPSPNAASLGKYGDIPVGLYTGIPNVSVPLYTITVGKYSLPISLSYHSQGLKVEERAGWVGLGWSLNAGGNITRTTKGLPDDLGGGFWNYPNWTLDTVAASGLVTQSVCGGTFYDLQPDLFYYNFGQNAGKFMMAASAGHPAHFIPFAPLKLAYTSNGSGINSFTVIDAEGIKYVFGAVESTIDETATTQSNSAWYLTRITTPGGDITFTYTSETTNSAQYSETQYLNTIGGSDANRYNPGYSSSYRYLTNNSIILSAIQFPTGTISFSTGSRKDFASASAITGMVINDMNGKVVHNFAFRESYFGDTASTAKEDVRLKLDSVIEISTTDAQSKVYAFGYNNPDQVPSVLSLAQDDQGFYNGKTDNRSLLPYIDPAVYGPFIAGQVTVHGDRTPSGAYAQVGVLNSITYPVGGTTQFIYEGNDYGNLGATHVNQQPIISSERLAFAGESNLVNIPVDTLPFSINVPQTATMYVQGHFTGPTPVYNGPTMILNKIDSTGARTQLISMYVVNTNSYQYPILSVGKYELIAAVDGSGQSMSVSIDYYNIDTVVAHLIKTNTTGGVRIKQAVNSDPVTGLQQFRNYRYVSLSDTTRSSGNLAAAPGYVETMSSYTYPGESYDLVSAGPLNYLSAVQGSHVGYATVIVTDSGSTGTNGKTVSTFNATYSNGNANIYNVPSVGLYRTEGIAALKKYVTDYSVYMGFPTSEYTYNTAGNLVKKTLFHYNTDSGFVTSMPNYYEASAIAGYQYQICHSGCAECYCPAGESCNACGAFNLDNFTLATYKVVAPWIYKTSTFDTTYDINGANPVGVAKYYYYDNPAHGQLTRVLETNSQGDSLKTVLIYPGDKSEISGLSASASSVLDSMVNRNMMPVVQEEHYHSNQLVIRSRTDFAIWNGSRRNISPAALWRQVGNNPIEQRVTYAKYDTVDNLIQAVKVGDMTVSYVYDYKNQYPVAEVKNADSASVAYSSFEADGTGGWTVSGGTISSASGSFTGTKAMTLSSGGSLSKAGLNSARKYIVSYWIKGTTPLTVPGTTGGAVITKNGWTYCQHLLSAGNTSVAINGAGTIDEVRCYPADAMMTSYTYAPLIGVSSIGASNNITTFYEYDGLARLRRVRDMDRNVLKQYDYQFFSQTFYSQPDTGVYQRTCLQGGSGTWDTIIVAAGTYTSLVSQDDANQQAQNYLNTHGQTLANNTGYCTYYNTIQIDSFQRSNCACLMAGGYVNDTIPAGVYTSHDSVGAANRIAMDTLLAQGPALANIKGACNSTCTGSIHKSINCSCETGTLQIISQYETGSEVNLQCVTVFGYFFSDGSYQYAYTSTDGGHCP